MSSNVVAESRVRIMLGVGSAALHLLEEGVVARVDARGVLVRLDSEREVLCEPKHLIVLLPPVTPGSGGK
jgi:hypothetical protein